MVFKPPLSHLQASLKVVFHLVCHTHSHSQINYIPFSLTFCNIPEYNLPPVLFTDRPDKYTIGRGRPNLASCQVSLNYVQRFERSRKCLSQSEAWAVILFFFSIGPKNHNFIEDIEILLPVKFRWKSFSGFRGEVENVSSNQRPGRPPRFFDRLEKNKNLVEDVDILLHVKFRWIMFSCLREVENVSANQRPWRPSCFNDQPEKHKLGRGCWHLAFCQLSLDSVQRFKRSRKCLIQSKAIAAILFFRSAQITQNLVEDVDILLPVKFPLIPFSRGRGEVENVSADQRPGRPSCFSDRLEKHKLGRRSWDLASSQVLLNSVQRFQRRSRKCLRQSEARTAILFFWSARKTQTW